MTDHSSSRSRQAASIALRIILPFWSMKQTVRLAKQEAAKTKENWEAIKDLSAEAKQALFQSDGGSEAGSEALTFEQAMANRKPGAMSVEQLQLYFLRRKRAALLAGAIFWMFGLIGVVTGYFDGSMRTVIQSLLSIAAATPLFFALALSAQFRLWQLETRRLSEDEKGGFADFQNENPDWLIKTLNPLYGKHHGAEL